jgi:outer membrane biosynthesis protein TonB
MDVTNEIFELKSLTLNSKVRGRPLGKGRYLIGSMDSCDIVIDDQEVLPIHAVLEISPRSTKIYSLDAGLTILVNGEKKVSSSLSIGDTVKIAKVVLHFENYIGSERILPTVPSTNISENAKLSKTQSVQGEADQEVPFIIHPFGEGYNFDTSEYIFEDSKDIYPIFKYNHDRQVAEVIVVFKKRIFSVDFIGDKDGIYKLAGVGKGREQLEYPYLGKEDLVNFIEVRGTELFVNKLNGYKIQEFSDDKKSNTEASVYNLKSNDIVSFKKGELSIVVRNVESPPNVASPPFLPRDKSLLLLCLFAVVFLSVPMYFIYNLEVNKEKIEKEKAPERIAKILYNRKKLMKVKPTPKEKVVIKKPEPKKMKDQPKPEVKKLAEKAPGPKIPVKEPPKKLAKGNPPKKVSEKPVPGPPKKKVAKSASASQSKKAVGKAVTKSSTSSPTPDSKGTIDVYKNTNFQATVSSLLAKGGEFKGIKTKGSSAGASSFQGTQGATGGSGVSSATVSDTIGSPNGIKNGVQGFASGAEGLVGSKTFYTAGIPSETVIMGSMDPDIIRKILRDHIPQFRFCYQKEIDRTGQKYQGAVKMIFTIGASGSVRRAGVEGNSDLPASVKRCVSNVLKGIQFPKPLGGGQVEVNQPINFYPRSN